MKKTSVQILLFLTLVATLTLLSCENNVYMDPYYLKDSDLWMVNGKYFPTLQEAMDYIYETTKSKSMEIVPAERTAVLQRDVMNGDRGGGLIVPEDFEGQLIIDFNTFTYEFDDSLDHFFEIIGGDEVYITNGTTVIYNEADHKPFALAVNTDVVRIDSHLIDDRRWDPVNDKSDAKLFDVGEKGSLVVSNISAVTDDQQNETALRGVVSVVTDGTTGGRITIENTRVVIDNILTRYKDEEGEVSDTIPAETSIPEEAKTDITISSGYVTINKIETLSDYYKKEESDSTVTLFTKAKINIFSTDAEDNTKIENPHDTETDKIDTAIQTIINAEEQEIPVDHEIVHDFDDDHIFSAVEPTCLEDGHIFYRQCIICGEYFDEKGNMLDSEKLSYPIQEGGTVLPALGHNLKKHTAVAPTCTEEGSIEYWHCIRCGDYFLDEEATTGITQSETVIPALGHNWGDWTEDNEETHSRTCSRCGETETEHHHFSQWTKTDEHYERTCSDCGRVETRPLEHVHELVHVARIEPDCTETGTIEHWYCSICQKLFSDENGTNEVTAEALVIPALGHSTVSVPATEPTCEGYGNIEYWVCSRCGEYFWDKEGTTELSEEERSKTVDQGGVLISPTGHSPKSEFEYDMDHHWHVCVHDDSHILNKEEHTWDEGQFYDNGQSFVYTCTICGAKKSISAPEYEEYNIGIGTILVPTGVIPAPSGDMVITREGNICTVTYVPHLNSPTDYEITCIKWFNGVDTKLESHSDLYGNYVFELINSVLPYRIEMYITNLGGTITREETVWK